MTTFDLIALGDNCIDRLTGAVTADLVGGNAVNVAVQGAMLTFGVVPTRAETGYGYIHTGAELAPGVLAVSGFAEKPDAPTAQRYLDEGYRAVRLQSGVPGLASTDGVNGSHLVTK